MGAPHRKVSGLPKSPALADCERAWAVNFRPALRSLPLWKWPIQLLMRFCYFVTEIGDIHSQCITTDEKLAKRLSKRPGWYAAPYPVASTEEDVLPEETCQYGTLYFESSSARTKYRERNLTLVAVKRADMGPPPEGKEVGCWQRVFDWLKCFKSGGRAVTENGQRSSSEGLLDCLGKWVREAKRDAASVNLRLEKIEHELAAQAKRRDAHPHADD